MSEKSVSDNDISTRKGTAYKRLPCRGCTVDCKNYKHCDGLLWRMGSSPVTDEQKK